MSVSCFSRAVEGEDRWLLADADSNSVMTREVIGLWAEEEVRDSVILVASATASEKSGLVRIATLVGRSSGV